MADSTRSVADDGAIRGALRKNEAILLWVDVVYGSGRHQVHLACVVRDSGEPRWERLAGSGPEGTWTADDRALARRFAASLAGRGALAEIEGLAARLHDQRIAPVLKHLEGVTRLHVVSVGEMAGVPIEALTGDFTISYVPSGTFLARLKDRPRPAGGRLLALGDPVFRRPGMALRGGNWKDLPGTRVEVHQISHLLGDEHQVMLDSQASEQSLEALRASGELARFRYLHFATHGEANQNKAFESVLILAQDGLPDELASEPGKPFMNGELSAREVLDYWKLNADLVTLSACETAVGKAGGGDGQLGFAQALLTSGARSVLLSLWKVDDAATALLMTRFYQNLLGKRPGLTEPLSKADSLAEAKRWLRELTADEALALTAAATKGVVRGDRGKGEDLQPIILSTDASLSPRTSDKPFADPRYWSAFILIGEP